MTARAILQRYKYYILGAFSLTSLLGVVFYIMFGSFMVITAKVKLPSSFSLQSRSSELIFDNIKVLSQCLIGMKSIVAGYNKESGAHVKNSLVNIIAPEEPSLLALTIRAPQGKLTEYKKFLPYFIKWENELYGTEINSKKTFFQKRLGYLERVQEILQANYPGVKAFSLRSKVIPLGGAFDRFDINVKRALEFQVDISDEILMDRFVLSSISRFKLLRTVVASEALPALDVLMASLLLGCILSGLIILVLELRRN